MLRWFYSAGAGADAGVGIKSGKVDISAHVHSHVPERGHTAIVPFSNPNLVGQPSLASFGAAWRQPATMHAVREFVRRQANGSLVTGYPTAEEPVYFLHIPKTAGTSVNRFLERAIGEPVRTYLWDQLVQEERCGAVSPRRLYSGHLHLHLDRFLLKRTRKFTVLRNPVSRTISHYVHARSAGDHPYHELAQRLSLYEFCMDSRTRHMVENYQSRYLVDFMLDVKHLSTLVSDSELGRYTLQDFIEQCTLGVLDDDGLLRAVLANLEHFEVVGVTEAMGPLTQQIAEMLGISAPEFNERHNVANGHRISEDDLDSTTLRSIEDATRVDRLVYEAVQQRLRK